MKKSIFVTVFFSTLFGLNSCKNKKELLETETIVPVPSLNVRLKISIDQDLGTVKDTILPAYAITSKLLEDTGFELVDSNSRNNNLTLKIKLQGIAQGGQYVSNHGRQITYFYTGAKINGTFYFLDSSGIEFGNNSYNGSKELEGSVFVGKTKPSDAPFKSAFSSSNFFKELGGVITKIYGTDAAFFYWCSVLKNFRDLHEQKENAIQALGDLRDARIIKPLLKNNFGFRISLTTDAISKIGAQAVDPLVNILNKNDNNYVDKAFAACALGKIGDKRAIEPLTKTLKSESPLVRFWCSFALICLGNSEKAKEALKKFTDVNLGIDSERWSEWWEENSFRYYKH